MGSCGHQELVNLVEALEFVEACGSGLSQGLFKFSEVSRIFGKIFSCGCYLLQYNFCVFHYSPETET